jgi:ankyrin repeat protein
MNTIMNLFFALLIAIPTVSNAESVYNRVLSKALFDGDNDKSIMTIEKGADVNKIEYYNFNRMPLSSIKILVENNYNLNDKSKGCVLINVMQKREIKDSFVETVDYLIKNGAPVNCVTDGGTTVLHKVSIKRNKEHDEYLKAYKLILDKTNQVNSWSTGGLLHKFKPLYVPIVQFNKEIFGLLIRKGADINGHTKAMIDESGKIVAKQGLTPLAGAVYLGDLELVKWVLSKGARINEVISGMSAIDYAHSRREDDIEMFLLEKGAKYKKYSKLN